MKIGDMTVFLDWDDNDYYQLYIGYVENILYDIDGNKVAIEIKYAEIYNLSQKLYIKDLKFNPDFCTKLVYVDSFIADIELAIKQIPDSRSYKNTIQTFLTRFLHFKTELQSQYKKLDSHPKELWHLISAAEQRKEECIKNIQKSASDIYIEIIEATKNLFEEKNKLLTKKIMDDLDYEGVVKLNKIIKCTTKDINNKYDKQYLNRKLDAANKDIEFFKNKQKEHINSMPARLKELEFVNKSVIEKYQPLANFLEKILKMYEPKPIGV